jgi:hypothetical protein
MVLFRPKGDDYKYFDVIRQLIDASNSSDTEALEQAVLPFLVPIAKLRPVGLQFRVSVSLCV